MGGGRMSNEYDLVKVLNDPEDYYPGNFETPEKANAFLMCLCQEAADEIERLREKTNVRETPGD
jgi:hypothetical protein